MIKEKIIRVSILQTSNPYIINEEPKKARILFIIVKSLNRKVTFCKSLNRKVIFDTLLIILPMSEFCLEVTFCKIYTKGKSLQEENL